jgi:folate-binding protein YgfZ
MNRIETMVILEDVQSRDLGTLEPGPVIDETARIEAGIPKRGVDFTEKTLPPELGPAFEARHVSYNKGCYMGQEVLMRMHSRGHTNKTWVGILLDSPVEVDAVVWHESRADAGVVTSAAVSPRLGPIAAAMLRNEAAQEGAEVRVGEVRGVVKNFPLIRD